MIGKRIPLSGKVFDIKARIHCNGEDLYIIETGSPDDKYDVRCIGCRSEHMNLPQKRGFYAKVNTFRQKLLEKKDLTASAREIIPDKMIGRYKGIQGETNSCYLDTTLYCLFALTERYDHLLTKSIDSSMTILKEVLGQIAEALRKQPYYSSRLYLPRLQ